MLKKDSETGRLEDLAFWLVARCHLTASDCFIHSHVLNVGYIIFTYICLISLVNVGKQTTHGVSEIASGYFRKLLSFSHTYLLQYWTCAPSRSRENWSYWGPYKWPSTWGFPGFFSPIFHQQHPWNLTWNLKRSPWKRRFLLETIMFRLHVKFRGSIPRHPVIPAEVFCVLGRLWVWKMSSCMSRIHSCGIFIQTAVFSRWSKWPCYPRSLEVTKNLWVRVTET